MSVKWGQLQKEIQVVTAKGETRNATTYVVKDPKRGLKTSSQYVSYILTGLNEHRFPAEYSAYVCAQIIKNNPALAPNFGS